MTALANLSLLNALACGEQPTATDETQSQVAIEWFAKWLENRAQFELNDGQPESADALMRASYALTHTE